jgi:hypothetical protein
LQRGGQPRSPPASRIEGHAATRVAACVLATSLDRNRRWRPRFGLPTPQQPNLRREGRHEAGDAEREREGAALERIDRVDAHDAIFAVARAILASAYRIIARREPARELGADYLDRQEPAATARRLARRLQRLGFAVTVGLPGCQAASPADGVLTAST